MDSSKSIEDDTIRDQMESGYVATRPRFTRARRTWKVNVRNLEAEDVRALDQFTMVRAARGGNAFLFPNLVPNGSFEFPADLDSDVVRDWYTAGDETPLLSIATETFIPGGPNPVPFGAVADEGITALKFQTVAGQVLDVGARFQCFVEARNTVPVTPGETYLFHCRWMQVGAENPYCSFSPMAYLNCDYAYGQYTLFTVPGTFSGETQWTDFYSVLTIPSGENTNTVDFRMRIQVSMSNAGTAPITLNGSNVFLIDEVDARYSRRSLRTAAWLGVNRWVAVCAFPSCRKSLTLVTARE